jgi:hypothetical protein
METTYTDRERLWHALFAILLFGLLVVGVVETGHCQEILQQVPQHFSANFDPTKPMIKISVTPNQTGNMEEFWGTGGTLGCYFDPQANLNCLNANIYGNIPGSLPSGAENGALLNVSSSLAGWLTSVNFTTTSPWIDPTSFEYGAQCNGSTDDTAPLQAALNALPGGGTLFIPSTGAGGSQQGCLVNGAYAVVTAISITSNVETVTFAATPALFQVVGAPVDLENIPTGAGSTNFDGICPVATFTATTITCSRTAANDSSTPLSNSIASLGLWSATPSIKIFGLSEAPHSGVTGSLVGGPALLAGNPIYVFTNTSTDGPEIAGITFADKNHGSATKSALGGVYLWNTNAANIHDNDFSQFEGGTKTGAQIWGYQSGVGLMLDGGYALTGSTNPWTQFFAVTNNSFFLTRLNISSRNKVSSVWFAGNNLNCSDNSTTILSSSVGMDIGWLWLQNASSLTNNGGENTVTGGQINNCQVGVGLGLQNDDVIFSKSELNLDQTTAANFIGASLLSTVSSELHIQTKQYPTGIHVDTNSTGNTLITDPYLGACNGALPTSNTPPACKAAIGQNNTGDGGSFANASLVIDSGAQSTTEALGFVNATLTANSTFTTDNFPSLFSTTINATTVNVGASAGGSVNIGGAGGSALGILKLFGSDGSSIQVEGNSSNVSGPYRLPTVTTTEVTAQPSANNEPLVSTTAGARSWSVIALPASLSANNNMALVTSTTGAITYLKAGQVVQIIASQAFTATALAPVTGLSWTLDASTTYQLSCDFIYQTSAASGTAFKLGLDDTEAPTLINVGFVNQGTISSLTFNTVATNNTGTGGASTVATTNLWAHAFAVITNGAATGTLTVQADSNSSSNTLTIEPGSSCVLY